MLESLGGQLVNIVVGLVTSGVWALGAILIYRKQKRAKEVPPPAMSALVRCIFCVTAVVICGSAAAQTPELVPFPADGFRCNGGWRFTEPRYGREELTVVSDPPHVRVAIRERGVWGILGETPCRLEFARRDHLGIVWNTYEQTTLRTIDLDGPSRLVVRQIPRARERTIGWVVTIVGAVIGAGLGVPSGALWSTGDDVAGATSFASAVVALGAGLAIGIPVADSDDEISVRLYRAR